MIFAIMHDSKEKVTLRINMKVTTCAIQGSLASREQVLYEKNDIFQE
jgi:hypothetical protein